MSIKINNISHNTIPVFRNNFAQNNQKTKNTDNDNKKLLYSLAGLGVIALSTFAFIKTRKKTLKPNVQEEIKNCIKKTNIKNLTEAEREKLIKELQAKTDNPDTKAEIRKLVENGEWDKL